MLRSQKTIGGPQHRKKLSIKKAQKLSTKKAINIIKLMEAGLSADPEELEVPEDEEPIEDTDHDEEDYNEDSEHPSGDWETEWSSWCEDTETIGLRKFLSDNFDWISPKKSEREIIVSILHQNSDKETRGAIEECNHKKIKEGLQSLVEIYDFNYHALVFGWEILPDVILRREKIHGEWIFQIEIPIQSADTVNQAQQEDWTRTLTDFSELLKNAIPGFFGAENFELAGEEMKKKLRDKGWTQISLAKDLCGKEPETDEERKKWEKKVDSWKNVISKISNYRYIQIDFFDKRILPFAFFFRERRRRVRAEAFTAKGIV